MKDILESIEGFEWDLGNKAKNWLKHGVIREECEEAFFDPHAAITQDLIHSIRESRFILLGKTKNGRLLYIAFTVRRSLPRVISARDLNKKEYYLYE